MNKVANGMRAVLAAALLVLTATTCVFANHQLPWKTFSEQAKDGVSADMGQCAADKEFFTARFERDGDAYRTFYGVESNMYVVIYYKGNIEGALADEVGIGKVDSAKHDDIPELTWMSVDAARARYPSVCVALFPEKS